MKTLAEYATLFSSHTVRLASGASVHYREANRTAKKTIIIVHGITGTHYSMLQMGGVWAERGDHVIALDLPGHGKSERISLIGFEDLADWLHQFITTVYPKGDFILMGNSFGSSVCAAYAVKYGLRGNSGMVLGAPIPSVNILLGRLEKLSTWLPDIVVRKVYYENRLLELIRIHVLLGELFNREYRRALKEMIRIEASVVQHSYAFGQLMPYAYSASPLARPLTKPMRNRTRVVHGNKDRIAGRDVHKKMRHFAGNEQVTSVKGTGHLVHLEAIPHLTKAIDDLLDN